MLIHTHISVSIEKLSLPLKQHQIVICGAVEPKKKKKTETFFKKISFSLSPLMPALLVALEREGGKGDERENSNFFLALG